MSLSQRPVGAETDPALTVGATLEVGLVVVVLGLDAGFGGWGRALVDRHSSAGKRETWTTRYLGPRAGERGWKIQFVDAAVGYVSIEGPGTEGVVLRTGDGGATCLATLTGRATDAPH